MLERLFPNFDPASLVGKIVLLVIVTSVAAILQRIVVRISRRALEAAEVPSASIFVNVERGLIWSFALLAVLQPVFGVEPTGFVAAIGVTSVALSLGLQDTISNLIGGLSLMLTRIIVPGDVITVGSFTGTVTDINWRSTCVKARGGNVEVIPNSVLSKSSFTKLTTGAAQAASTTFVVSVDADPEQVEREMLQVASEVLGELAAPGQTPSVKYGSMDAYGVTVTLTCFMAEDAVAAAVSDRISRALVGKPWLARAV